MSSSKIETRPVVVPLVDRIDGAAIYSPSLLHYALVGAVVLGFVLGYLGHALASGVMPVAGLGQWAAGGAAPATFAGAGIGVAIGALCGALIALFRMPRR